MSEPLAPAVEEALRRAARGEGDARALAEALGASAGMVVVWSNDAAVAYLKALGDAVGPNLEHYGDVKAGDVPEPPPAGRPGAGGALVPRAFTTQESANAWARANGLVNANDIVVTQVRPWARGLSDSLWRGDAGVVIDEGTDRPITLDRPGVARLVALLTLPSIAALPALRAVTVAGGLHAQPAPDGSTRQAFAFDGEGAAARGLPRLEAGGGAAVGAAGIATRELLDKMTRAGVGRLVVNPGLPDERWYDAEDLAAMLRLALPAAPPAAPVPAILARARARPTPAAIAGPGRDDAAGRAFWAALEARSGLAWWQVAEALAFEMDVHVEVHGEPAEGLRWPAFYHMREDAGGGTVAFLFSGAAAVREELGKRGGGASLALSGVEALRWIVAAPAEIGFVTVDAHLGGGARKMPMSALLGALLPVAYEIADLKQVPAVGLDRLGRLPGARALKPEAVRALALGWRNLVGFKEPRIVTVAGRPRLAIASSIDAFFASLSREEGRVAPDPAGKEPPFARWLAAAAACDGLVLDAGGGAPLGLDPIDLLVLDRWAAHPERQPKGGEVVAEAARLLAAGTLGVAAAGRIAADLPGYYIGYAEASGQTHLAVFPDTDAVCLFTSRERAQQYIERLAAFRPGLGMQPGAVRQGWAVNPFVMALDGFTEAWIDPEDPRTGGGLRLPRAGVEAAVARLDETLKPRVPGFVAA